MPYEATQIEVDATGEYDLTAVFGDGFDGIAYLYEETFDASAPLTGGIQTGTDPFDATAPSVIAGATLTEGEVYTLVLTGFGTTDSGEYTVYASGPGTVSVIGDCPADRDNDGDKDVQDLLSYLRSFRARNADMDGDQDTDVQDLLGYLRAFRAGC